MSIRRAPRPDENFYVLDKHISEDARLGWAARGLLIYLLGKPDNWEISTQDLINQTGGSTSKSGRDAVYALIKQLTDAGYIRRIQTNGAGGKFGAVEYEVCETPFGPDEPLPENPDAAPLTAQPYTAEPLPANPTLIRTEYKQELKVTRTEHTQEARLRASRLPEGFSLTPERRSYAAEHGLSPGATDTEFENFTDYWKAENGPKATKRDWDAAWRTWVRRSVSWAGRSKPSGPAQAPQRKPAFAGYAAAISRIIPVAPDDPFAGGTIIEGEFRPVRSGSGTG